MPQKKETGFSQEKNKPEHLNQLIFLQPWQEYVDTPTDIKEQEGHRYFIFRNGKALRIPAEYIGDTKSIKGKKISILATDIPGKELLIKTVGETDE